MSWFGFGNDASQSPSSTDVPYDERVETFNTLEGIDFKAFGEKNISIFLNRHTGEDNVTTWEIVDDGSNNNDHVKIWRGSVSCSNWSPFRASRIFPNVNKSTLENILLDANLLLQLDEMTDTVKVLKVINERLSVRQVCSKAIFPVAARELVVVTYATTLDSGEIVIASRSIKILDVELREDAVLANGLCSGYIIEDVENGCRVTLMAHANLSGYVPSSIVNMLGTSATVTILSNLQKLVNEKNGN